MILCCLRCIAKFSLGLIQTTNQGYGNIFCFFTDRYLGKILSLLCRINCGISVCWLSFVFSGSLTYINKGENNGSDYLGKYRCNGFKTLLRKKTGQEGKLLYSVHRLESDTSSRGRKIIVREKLKKAGVD
ncbi:MAG: hypothetical protein D3924_03320 [Candidatus Electrothrix sp. AR4]|nr:hypothetical protein [Candidatus Electrothrix sp. AR4]